MYKMGKLTKYSYNAKLKPYYYSKILYLPKRNGLSSIIIKYIKKAYFKILDSQVKNISAVSTEFALEYIERLDKSKPENIKMLTTSIKHADSKVVLRGIELLSQIKTIEAKKAIKVCLSSNSQEITIAAIDAIKLFEDVDIINPLKNCLKRRNKKIALHALWTLAGIKSNEAISVIKEALDNNDEEIKRTADWILKGTHSTKRTKHVG